MDINSKSLLDIIRNAGATDATLAVTSLTVTKFRTDGEKPLRKPLNTPAELSDNVEFVGAKNTQLTVMVPKDNVDALTVARKIADAVAKATDLTVSESDYKDYRQVLVGNARTASGLASLLKQ